MKNSRGLTLIELMVTLVVFAIVAVLAFPGFQLYMQNSNRVTQINDLIATFNMARSEAVKRNLPVMVCASADQATCSGVNDWTTGWIAFIDDNPTNDSLDLPAETVFYVHGALSGANLLYTDTDSGAVSIRFDNRGMPTVFDAAAATNNFATFMRCDDRRNTDSIPDAHARAVILTTSGRTRLSQDSTNDGSPVHQDFAGVDLNCP